MNSSAAPEIPRAWYGDKTMIGTQLFIAGVSHSIELDVGYCAFGMCLVDTT